MSEPRRHWLVARFLPAALVLWAVVGWGLAVLERGRRPLRDPPQAEYWHLRPDSPRISGLRRFLAVVDSHLPAPARVAVAVPLKDGSPSDRMFRYLWVAYLLPRHEVVPPWRAAATRPQYWASFRGAGLLPPDAVEMARWPEGALYRLTRSAYDPGAGAQSP